MATALDSSTVLVDMDGVLADFDSEVLRRLSESYPDVPILGDRNNFYISEDYPEHQEIVKSISKEEGFFSDLPLIDGALHGWSRIM